MANYNKVILVGNLTRDPQLSYLPNQTAGAEIGMAINHRWREGGVGKKPLPPSLSHCQHQLPFKTKSARGAAFLATHPPTTHPGS